MTLLSTIKCSDFVRRQTPQSGFSHFDGTWEELEKLVRHIFLYYPKNVRSGYKDGVFLVDIHPLNRFYIDVEDLNFPHNAVDRFYSSIIPLTDETKIVANYAPRQPGEQPFIRLAAEGKKERAKYATVVLYRADVLAEDDDRSTDADYEIIAIKARTSEQEEPMDPYTMARNFLHLKGGTKGDFTAQQFAESIVFWNNHCMAMGKRSLWKRFCNWLRSKLCAFGHHCWEHPPVK